MAVGAMAVLLSLSLSGPAEAPAGATTTPPDKASVSPADAPVLPDAAADAELPPAQKPGFGGWFDFDNSLGGGALVANPYVNNPAWSTNLYLKPGYAFRAWNQTLKVSGWENIYYADILDKNAFDQRQIDWSDLRLTLSDDSIYEEPHTHIKIGGMIRGVVPLSYASRFDSMITAIWAGVIVSRSFYGVDLKAGVLAAKEFHRYTTAQFPCSDSSVEPVAVTPGEAPSGGFLNAFTNGICSPGNGAASTSTVTPTALVDNVSWDLVPYFDVQWNMTDRWSLGATVYYFDQFAYPIPVDSLSSQVVDSNGNQVAQSQGRADSFWMIASLGYNLTDKWQISVGLWDTSLPKTNDNRSLVPWFLDPYQLATNDWTAFFDVALTL
ncbi:MAG TPA: hypothetical protein VMB50_23810 [Myxococcales bacterium]|nr:hypothetical protein [Myxococcales bacterium]